MERGHLGHTASYEVKDGPSLSGIHSPGPHHSIHSREVFGKSQQLTKLETAVISGLVWVPSWSDSGGELGIREIEFKLS